MMVLCQVVSAAEGYCLQLMVGQVPAECKTGSAEGAMERVTGVFHAIGLEGGFQASFVQTAVVGHQGQTFNQGYDFAPHLRERGGMGRILKGHPVNLRVPVIIVIGIGAYQTVMPDGYFPGRGLPRGLRCKCWSVARWRFQSLWRQSLSCRSARKCTFVCKNSNNASIYGRVCHKSVRNLGRAALFR